MRFGFLGLGFATRELHLPAVRSLSGAVPVGGVDPDPTSSASWNGLEGGPVYASMAELVDRGKPDVVVVATPPATHAELAVAALEAGCHVMCEKPFTTTVAEADAVLRVAAIQGRSVCVNHEFRYMPIFAAIPRSVGSPDVGRAVFLHCTQFMDLAPWAEKVPWRAAMPDRTLFEGGVHLVDLLHMIVGRLPRRVHAMTSAGLDPARSADAIHLVNLDYGGGVLGQITIDRLCPAGTRYVDLRIDCERASIRASHGGRAQLRVGVKRAEKPGVRLDYGLEGLAWLERGFSRRTLARNPRQATRKATLALYEDTVAALERGTEPPTTAAVAAQTLRIIEAAYRSAREGEQVTIEN